MKQTFLDITDDKLARYLPNIRSFLDKWISIEGITVLMSIVSLVLAILSITSGILSVIALAFYPFFFLSFIGFREYVLGRKARYSEASDAMAECQEFLKHANHAIQKNNSDLAYEYITSCLTSFSKAMTLITGVNCRSCIKSLDCNTTKSKNDKEAYVTKTFCRCSTADRTKDEWVPISENTDFSYLTKNRTRNSWLSNDISKITLEGKYKNSSFKNMSRDELQEYFENKQYSYISAIIWPISMNDRSESGEDDFTGFLCVDSKSRGVFNTYYDVKFGMALAGPLFWVLRGYSEIKIQTGEREKC